MHWHLHSLTRCSNFDGWPNWRDQNVPRQKRWFVGQIRCQIGGSVKTISWISNLIGPFKRINRNIIWNKNQIQRSTTVQIFYSQCIPFWVNTVRFQWTLRRSLRFYTHLCPCNFNLNEPSFKNRRIISIIFHKSPPIFFLFI